MKNVLKIAALLVWVCTSVQAQNHAAYEIKGQLTGLSDTVTLFLVHAVNGVNDTVAVTKPNSGRFTFAGMLQRSGEFHHIHIQGQTKVVGLLLEHAPFTLGGEFGNWPSVEVNGTTSHHDYQRYAQTVDQLAAKQDSLQRLKAEATKAKDKVQLRTATLGLSKVVRDYTGVWRTFIKEHPGSLYTPYLIMTCPLEETEKQALFDALESSVKTGYYGHELARLLQLSSDAAQIEVGDIMPDFSSLTPDDKPLLLHDVLAQGKLTFIDFWASWCGPCRSENPYLKSIYDEYRDNGLVILGVSLDQNRASWIEAIKADELDWHHLISEKRGGQPAIAELFGVKSIPHSILVDSTGKVLARGLRGEQLKAEIAKHLVGD